MAAIVVSHRTAPLEAPENSLAGIQAATEQGADAVEIDLRMSLDLRPFLMHDWTMRRTTGWPLPLELTPSYQIRLRRLQDSNERVPSLTDALDALSPQTRLAVDVKTPWAVIPLVKAIKRRGLQARTLVWCQSALAVRYAVRAAPEAEVAYLKDVRDPAGKLAFLAKAKRLGAQAVSAHWDAVDAEFVASAHSIGLRVYSFDYRNELAPAKLRAGLDGLITDHVVAAREALEAAGQV
jgi:glycerophosphoryl diester phosphodiesterase